MAVTSNSGLREPGLREIALKIVSVPGFGDSEASLTRALEAWRKALTPQQWHHAAEALICSFLLDVRAEYERGLPAVRQQMPDLSPRVGGIKFVEAEPDFVDEFAGEPNDVPAAVLRHHSESEGWSVPPTLPAPSKPSSPERTPTTSKHRPSPSPKFGPVIVSHVAARTPASEPQAVLTAVRSAPAAPAPAPAPKPVHVQQDGWKVPALRNMKVFPSLANRVTINGVATREGELTKAQIPVRLEQIEMQRRASRDKDTHQQARIDRRNELNRQDEAEMRVRRALAQELQAEADRLAAVERVLAERPDGTTITDLDADVLIECGYQRRSE